MYFHISVFIWSLLDQMQIINVKWEAYWLYSDNLFASFQCTLWMNVFKNKAKKYIKSALITQWVDDLLLFFKHEKRI